jgi:hypothetical protein
VNASANKYGGARCAHKNTIRVKQIGVLTPTYSLAPSHEVFSCCVLTSSADCLGPLAAISAYDMVNVELGGGVGKIWRE